MTVAMWTAMFLAEKYGRLTLTLEEVAEQIGLSPGTIRNRRVRGEFAWLRADGRALCADVSDVAALACKAFPRWRLDAGQARLFLAAKAGAPKPQLPAPGALTGLEQLAEEATLEGAGVAPGAWLEAAPTSPGGPGGGSTPQSWPAPLPCLTQGWPPWRSK